MRINHRRRNILMSKMLLDGANVRSALQCVRCETVAKRVAAGSLRDSHSGDRDLNGLIDRCLVNVVPANYTAPRIA